MRHILVCLLLTATLAGCADGPDPVTEDPLGPPDAETTATTGAISGVVVDPTITPIAGATVTLTGQETGAETDADGIFVFEGLEPGTYFIQVVADGYLLTQSSAQVEAGAVAKLRVLLDVDTTPQPQSSTVKFDAYMEFSDFYAVYILTDVIGPNDLCRCKFSTQQLPALETVVVEGYWTPSMERYVNEDLYWDVYSGDETGTLADSSAGCYGSGEPFHIPGANFDPADANIWALVSSGEQPDIQQEIEVFVTQFQVAPAPAGWSIDG